MAFRPFRVDFKFPVADGFLLARILMWILASSLLAICGLVIVLLRQDSALILGLCAISLVLLWTLYREIHHRQNALDRAYHSEHRYRGLVEDLPDLVCRFKPDGTLTYVNRTYADYFARSVEELQGFNFFQLIPESERTVAQQHLQSLNVGNPTATMEHQVISSDGGIRWHRWTDRVLFDNAGNVFEYQSVGHDMTDRKLTEQALMESEKRFRDFAETAADWFWEMDADLRYTFVSSGYEKHTGIPVEHIVGLTPFELFTDFTKDIAKWEQHHRDLEAHRPFNNLEIDWVRPDSTVNIFYASGKPIFGDDGQFKGYRGAGRNVTEQKHIEQALFTEKERAQVTLNSIGDGVIATDADGIVEYLNPVAEALTGWTLERARGQFLDVVFTVIDEESRKPMPSLINFCLSAKKTVSLSKASILLSRSGKEYAIQDSCSPIRNQANEIIGTVLVFSDATEARRIARETSYQAAHDKLTGLVNRHEFEHRLQRVLDDTRNDADDHALCYLDLDRFKIVNDKCGHIAGDELLRQIAALLRQESRKRDTLARIGGDEFGLLMEHCSINQAQRVADKMREAVAAYTFLWEEQTFNVGVSIGVIAVTAASGTLQDVLKMADTACYMAKNEGRNRVRVLDAELAGLPLSKQAQWLDRVQRALDVDDFQLYFQPIIALQGHGAGDHYELLIRMEDEASKIYTPDTFMSVVERYDLAGKLDRRVVYKALSWFAAHPEPLARLSLCEINLSAHSLTDATFPQFVIEQFQSFELPPARFCFTISESDAIANLASVQHLIQILKDFGCYLALDDFGSGLSSFVYLKSLAVDYLKINGTLVKNILDDPVHLEMVTAINRIGHLLGKQTIAEFVESAEILAKLRELGVDYAQGFHIERPHALDDML